MQEKRFTRPLRMGRQPNNDELGRIFGYRPCCCYTCLTGGRHARWRP